MIRVLIVDDEKIVRKGLVTFMPWQDYGMVVVGEANNGENALEFMKTNKVDLLLTDLSMPVMSGIELMREVRRQYPDVQIVVLTLHQNFEYIQEALRLGAVDYISKTQLEQEQFEDVLGRIATLMGRKSGGHAPALAAKEEAGHVDELFVLYALPHPGDDFKPDPSIINGAIEADVGVWYWPKGMPESAKTGSDSALVRFRGLGDMNHKSVMQLLRVYRKQNLFYDYDPSQPYFTVFDAVAFMNRAEDNASPDMNALKQSWLSPEWIFDDLLFGRMAAELKEARLPQIRLSRMFYTLTDEWNRLYRHLLQGRIDIQDSFSSWVDFEEWLRTSRESIRQSSFKPQYSAEIQNSIAKAMNLARQMMEQPLSAGEMAQMVNMSSSYFSQCFKQIVGQTYTDFLREIRMERAKEYLRNTTKTIQWIAEQIGYNDEKYFSRLFRDHVGMLPSDYRQK